MTKYEDLGRKLTTAASAAPVYEQECRRFAEALVQQAVGEMGWPAEGYRVDFGAMRDDGRLPFALRLTLKPSATGGPTLTAAADLIVDVSDGEVFSRGAGVDRHFVVRVGGHTFGEPRDPRDHTPPAHTLSGTIGAEVLKRIGRAYPTNG